MNWPGQLQVHALTSAIINIKDSEATLRLEKFVVNQDPGPQTLTEADMSSTSRK